MGFKYRFYQFFGGSFAALALSVLPAFAGELDDWEFDTSNSELTFSLSDQVFPSFFLMSEPPRLVLDIPDTEIGDIEPEQIYNGTVQSIRVAQHTPDNVRVVIELAPGTALSPGQADIQFDNSGDGQRRWRFRPLVADDEAVATTPTADPGSENEVSLSAASLQPSQQQATSTALPLDPYESDSSDVVSVPPLEDAPESTVPVAIATEAESPELPPMTAPELEAVDVENTEAPLETLETRPSSLPELSANTAPSDVSEPDSASTSEGLQSPSEENAAISDATPPSADGIAPAAETALAPVEASASEQTVFDDTENPAAPTIQQPAAERTIMQTDMPAPLTFGQPLPERSE